jgi:hypothetical protein
MSSSNIDEAEWAAFEADCAPLVEQAAVIAVTNEADCAPLVEQAAVIAVPDEAAVIAARSAYMTAKVEYIFARLGVETGEQNYERRKYSLHLKENMQKFKNLKSDIYRKRSIMIVAEKKLRNASLMFETMFTDVKQYKSALALANVEASRVAIDATKIEIKSAKDAKEAGYVTVDAIIELRLAEKKLELIKRWLETDSASDAISTVAVKSSIPVVAVETALPADATPAVAVESAIPVVAVETPVVVDGIPVVDAIPAVAAESAISVVAVETPVVVDAISPHVKSVDVVPLMVSNERICRQQSVNVEPVKRPVNSISNMTVSWIYMEAKCPYGKACKKKGLNCGLNHFTPMYRYRADCLPETVCSNEKSFTERCRDFNCEADHMSGRAKYLAKYRNRSTWFATHVQTQSRHNTSEKIY